MSVALSFSLSKISTRRDAFSGIWMWDTQLAPCWWWIRATLEELDSIKLNQPSKFPVKLISFLHFCNLFSLPSYPFCHLFSPLASSFYVSENSYEVVLGLYGDYLGSLTSQFSIWAKTLQCTSFLHSFSINQWLQVSKRYLKLRIAPSRKIKRSWKRWRIQFWCLYLTP